jgi:hypothetical protein
MFVILVWTTELNVQLLKGEDGFAKLFPTYQTAEEYIKQFSEDCTYQILKLKGGRYGMAL